MLLALQEGIVYGPVSSRRLGRSLGINALLRDEKLCTFDCTYCQYGWTNRDLLQRESARPLPRATEVLEAVERALVQQDVPPEFLTLCGNGEPTLHPELFEIVVGVNRLRDRLAPAARTAILSNSTTAGEASVRRALEKLDFRIMKLDAGTEDTFSRINRPAPGLSLEGVVRGLKGLENVTIQTMFVGGPDGNSAEDEIEAWIARVREIAPSAIQIYSLDRGYPSDRIEPLERSRLERIKARFEGTSIEVSVF